MDYDASGHYTGDGPHGPILPTILSYDSAGRNVHTQEPNAGQPTYRVDSTKREYDGDGQMIKEVRDVTCSTCTPNPFATYHIRSRALGGRAITTFDSPSGSPRKEHVYANGEMLFTGQKLATKL